MRKFYGFFDNGTYKVGCNGGSIYVYDRNETELTRFKGLSCTYRGAFRPGTNRFAAKSTYGTLVVYDLDTLSLFRSGRSDGYIGYRYKVYNATYQYEYLGTSYEGNNDCYASRTGSLTGAVRVGETEEIFINPENPRELFDFLAAESLKNGTLLSTALSVMGVLTLLALLFR